MRLNPSTSESNAEDISSPLFGLLLEWEEFRLLVMASNVSSGVAAAGVGGGGGSPLTLSLPSTIIDSSLQQW